MSGDTGARPGGSEGALARLPPAALVVLVVGLAAHNLVMSRLWEVGIRGGALDGVAGWKGVVLVGASGAALVPLGGRP